MADFKTGSCVAVANGGVGESGASSFLLHTVGAATPKTMVLRTVELTLCQNTGAVAMLVVNGQPVAQGDMTGVGNAIQAAANPGDVVVAITHTVPLFNGILCVRLGELSVVLEECDPAAY